MKIAFTPVVYEHAARFVGRTPWEVSRDEELMFEAHRRAYLQYRHQVIAVGIDIYNLEAEAYGATIRPCSGNDIPAIEEPIWATLEAGMRRAPFDPSCDGRIAMVLRVGQRLLREFPQADVRIPVAGPFSIAFNLRGISNLCEDAIDRPEDTAKMLMNIAENQGVFFRAIADAGLAVAFFESAAAPPILSPEQFRQVELPALKRCMEVAGECTGRAVPCIMGGNTFPIVDELLSTGTAYLVCNVETNQRGFVDRLSRTHPHVKIRVNLDPGVVACSDEQRIYRAVDEVLRIVDGRAYCVMGTGALPFETPIENMKLIANYVAD